jgi:Tol biopolymer transport system component/tRNA A-37 threonylcarbamoyl transferase component Bud32
MAIPAGTRLGTYEITTHIGSGGMGEVYQAHDTKLGRDVAIKVLPEKFARDFERLARFQREAKLLAALNHPNIATIHGLEQSGETHYLVMELVSGETLRDRILRDGGLPITETLKIAKQIAEALEAAHNNERAIIHRDLKPANVKVTPEGRVKVLDFGLAKAFAADAATEDPSNSPTLSMNPTQQGVIMGTAAYMSPEQARGSGADRSTDIWAFGCVLYELLTGKPAFQGQAMTDILASVVKTEPDWSQLPADTPPSIRTLLRRCLRKERHQRLQDAAGLRIEIEDVLSGGIPAAESTAAPAPIGRLAFLGRMGWTIAAAALVVGAALAGGGVWLLTRPGPAPAVRTEIATSGASALSIGGFDRDLAISPDGSHIVYRGNGRLLVRALDQLEPAVLTGVSGAARGPFFSPEGQWIGFVDGPLKKVAITGGPAVTIGSLDGLSRGATWGPDGSIVFATNNPTTGLFRVSEGGGEPAVLTRPNRERGETDHFWPEWLPGGQAVLFTITTTGGTDNSQVAVLDLRTGAQKTVVRGGSHAHYVESGHLVYAAAGTLRAVRFDLGRLETVGTSVPVVPEVVTTPQGGADFDVARNGTLVYVQGGVAAGTARTLVWVDRQGREEAIKAPARAYVAPRLTPDGTRIALDIRDQESDIWIWDLARETLTRLTFDPTLDRYPVWTPDSKRVIFASDRAGPSNLYWQAADNTGTVERLTESPNVQWPDSISPDGTRLIFEEQTTSSDLLALTLDKDRKAEPLAQSPMYSERTGEISPDGRWLAYSSSESGQDEIYVRPFPEVNSGKSQVSTIGGAQPLWARNGQELFYVALDGALMRVAVERGPSWRNGTPAKLFDNTYAWAIAGIDGPSYDISPDGRRFLAIKPSTEQTRAPTNLVVVQNWFEELKHRVPAGTK